MPVAGRGRGKFIPAKGKGKLFSAGVGNITTRDTPQTNTGLGNGDTGGGWGNNNSNGAASTDAWGNVHNDNNTDRFADSGKEVEVEFNVFNSNLARIIGKGGSNIQDIMAQSSATIDINKRDSDGTITPVVIKGSQLNCDHAKKMIDEICSKFNGLCDGAGGTASNSNGGGFGGMASGGDDGPRDDEDIWIPEDKCGRVIGRGGSKIQEIQDESGANVKVHGRETAEDGKVMVTLSGSEGQRAKAKEIIERCTADRGGGGGGGFSLPADAEPFEMWVESCRLGRVVGKGGSKIREIQDQFSIRVDIKKDEIKDDDTMVILTGSPSSTQQAKEYIDELCERSEKPDSASGGNGGGDSWGQTNTNADSGWGQTSSNNEPGWGGAAPASNATDGWGQVTGEPAW